MVENEEVEEVWFLSPRQWRRKGMESKFNK